MASCRWRCVPYPRTSVKKLDIGIVNDPVVAAAGARLAHTHSTALAGESGSASAALRFEDLLFYRVFIRRLIAQPWGNRRAS